MRNADNEEDLEANTTGHREDAKAQRNAWEEVWSPPGAPSTARLVNNMVENRWADCEPPNTGSHVRKAAASFSDRTASWADGLHVRHSAWLSDEALEYFASVFSFAHPQAGRQRAATHRSILGQPPIAAISNQ